MLRKFFALAMTLVCLMGVARAQTTPQTLQNQINSIPWTNGQQQVTGADVMQQFNTVVQLFESWAASLNSPTFTGTVTVPSGAILGTPASINITNATGYASFSQCINVTNPAYGANGTAGDGVRIQAALNAAQSASGHCVYFPSLGKPYIIDSGITIAYSVAAYGDGGMFFNGFNTTVAQWTFASTWFECTDPVNPCVSIPNHGTTFDGINLIWNQAAPPGSGTYNPISFPDGIYVTGTLFRIRHSLMVGGTRCINIDYNSTSGGGTYSELEDLKLGCLVTGIREKNIDDNVYASDIDVHPIWYVTNANVVAYTEAHLNGLDINYWDNPVIKAYQCIYCRSAFLFTNSTALGNTHAMSHGQMMGIQCNVVVICMDDSSGGSVTFTVDSMLAQGDTNTSQSAILFQFPTDNIDAEFGVLDIPVTGGSVFSFGGGTGGDISIGTLKLGEKINGNTYPGWANVVGSVPAFSMAAGAKLQIGQRNVVRPSSLSNAYIAGNGIDNVETPTHCWTPFATFGQDTVTGNAINTSLTADDYTKISFYNGFLQARISGQLNVTTAQTAGTAILYASNIANMNTTVDASTTGLKNFDSGWIDQADEGAAIVGRLMQLTTTGVVFTLGSITLCGR